jgi:hypothetical protein
VISLIESSDRFIVSLTHCLLNKAVTTAGEETLSSRLREVNFPLILQRQPIAADAPRLSAPSVSCTGKFIPTNEPDGFSCEPVINFATARTYTNR